MDFISNRQDQVDAMLAALKVGSIDELFAAIPQNLKLARPEEDDGLSEYEGMRLMEEIAANNTFSGFTSYLAPAPTSTMFRPLSELSVRNRSS